MALIALFQSCSGIRPGDNAGKLASAVDEAGRRGAEIIFTPEMTGLLDRNSERAAANVTVEEEDLALAAGRDAARRNGMWVHIGSLAVRSDRGKLANRSFVIDPDGEIRGRYDKLHLFDVDLPTGESWRESSTYRRGERAVMVEGTPVGRLGLTICYDLRFPSLFASLAEAGAEAIAVPAAFTVPTGRAHWQVLLRARAIEAGVFVIAAAQSGTHEDGRVTYGHSMVVDPWGDILLDMGDTSGVAVIEVDRERIAGVRARVPALSHRRPIPPVDAA